MEALTEHARLARAAAAAAEELRDTYAADGNAAGGAADQRVEELDLLAGRLRTMERDATAGRVELGPRDAPHDLHRVLEGGYGPEVTDLRSAVDAVVQHWDDEIVPRLTGRP